MRNRYNVVDMFDSFSTGEGIDVSGRQYPFCCYEIRLDKVVAIKRVFEKEDDIDVCTMTVYMMGGHEIKLEGEQASRFDTAYYMWIDTVDDMSRKQER